MAYIIQFYFFCSLCLLPMLTGCKVNTPQTQRANIYLKNIEDKYANITQKEDSVGKAPPVFINSPRAFTEEKAPSAHEKDFILTPQSLLLYVQKNAVPSQDSFSMDKINSQRKFNLWQFLPSILANVSINNPIYGYELQYYNNRDFSDNIYAYISIAWNANILSKFRTLKELDAEKKILEIKQRINKEQLLIATMGMYYQIVEKSESIQVARKEIKLKEKELDSMQADGQAYSKYNINDAKIRLMDLRSELDQYQFEHTALLLEIKKLLELPFSTLKIQQEKLPSINNVVTASAWKNKARSNNTQVRLASFAAKSLRDAEEYIKYEPFANVNFFVTLPQINLREEYSSHTQGVSVGLHWTIPFFDAGETTYKYEQIAIQKRELAHQTYKNIEEIEYNIDKQHNECAHLARSITKAENLLSLLHEKYTYLLEMTQQGQAKDVDILASELEISKKEAELRNLRQKWAFGYMKLQVLSGEIAL